MRIKFEVPQPERVKFEQVEVGEFFWTKLSCQSRSELMLKISKVHAFNCESHNTVETFFSTEVEIVPAKIVVERAE